MNAVLTAQIRTERGKGAAKKLRATGACPAVVYGPGAEPFAVTIDPKIFVKVLSSSGENALIDLSVNDADDKPLHTNRVIVRNIQYDPFRPLPTHVDFYIFSADRTLTLRIPVEITGTPEAVSTKTASLNQQTHELNVECLPGDIPSKIEVDVSGLQIGHSLHVSDLAIPAGVTVLDAPELAIATVSPIHEEVAATEEETAAEPAAAEPEVIRERKSESSE